MPSYIPGPGGLQLRQVPYVGDGAANRLIDIGIVPRFFFIYGPTDGEEYMVDADGTTVWLSPFGIITSFIANGVVGTQLDIGTAVIGSFVDPPTTNRLGFNYIIFAYG